MLFVLYGFGVVTFLLMTVRAIVILQASPEAGGRASHWLDATLGYVVPLGAWVVAFILRELRDVAWASSATLDELRQLRTALERREPTPSDVEPDAATDRPRE